MEFRKILTLRGPNIWSRRPVLEAWVDLKELKERGGDGERFIGQVRENVKYWKEEKEREEKGCPGFRISSQQPPLLSK